MGVAAAIRQLAWFYIPFYLILVYRESGPREALRRLTSICAVFAAVNLPFFWADPHAWTQGVLAPVLDPMFPMGIGLIGISLTGMLPLNAPAFWAFLELLALGVSTAWFFLKGYRYPVFAPILVVAPLWLSWRSLPSYFYAMPVFVFCLALLEYSRPQELLPTQEWWARFSRGLGIGDEVADRHHATASGPS
jgi:uncharacterized membrane protein